MAFLPKLCNFKLDTFTELEFTAKGQLEQLNTFCRDILGKITRRDFCALCNHFIDGFDGQ